MGGITAPVVGSASYPAWIARVSKPAFCPCSLEPLLMALTLAPGRIGPSGALGVSKHLYRPRGVTVLFNRRKLEIPTPDQALKGRSEQWFAVSDRHRVLDAPVVTDGIPDGYEVAVFGLGCF